MLPELYGNWEEKVKIAKNAGIKEIFIIYGDTDEDIKKVIPMYRNYLMGTQFKLRSVSDVDDTKVFLISPGMAEKIFKSASASAV